MHTSSELTPNGSPANSRLSCIDPALAELEQLKRQLLQAEVRLARARATVAGSEADVRALNARLRAFAK